MADYSHNGKQKVKNQVSSRQSLIEFRTDIPHIVKYMGSKRELIEYLVRGISEVYGDECVCDLFAGTSVLSGAIGHSVPIHSNDIQEYSAVFAKTYLSNYDWNLYPDLVETIAGRAQDIVNHVHTVYPELVFKYNAELSLNEFNALEQEQQELIYNDFNEVEHHLFIKNYSGTYWSFEQCLWIDAIRTAAMEYIHSPVYYPILSSLMFAMAYNAQSTGHYAQYRDAYDINSMNDIIIYRNKQILPYFKKKMKEFMNVLGKNELNHVVTTLDYRDCLDALPEQSLIYADPPYAFVHYSRFYHALETLVKYDYPEVAHKGRYRNDRHQSPFCKRTTVSDAFKVLFEKTREKRSKLILSYSNTGMIALEKILHLAEKTFSNQYHIKTKAVNYTHSTMGRLDDKSREVKEYLIIAYPKDRNV